MYTMTDQKQWKGRIDSTTNRSSFRLHQQVKRIAMNDVSASDKKGAAIIGFICDEGVRRNQGRVGAANGPNALREGLSSLPWTFEEEQQIIDVGNIICLNHALEEAQRELGDVVSTLLQKKLQCVVLGGGHETLYGHYLGVRAALPKDAKIGIINIDAHFDLRPYDEQPSSGTMFRQILEQDPHVDYFVVGIQRYGNTKELFEKADELQVKYVIEDDMTSAANIQPLMDDLQHYMDQHDYVLLTLCMDVLNAAAAPGVSAPSPFGLEPTTVRTILQKVTSHPHTHSFDICEVNPSLDENGRTVKLGAYFIYEALNNLLGGQGS
ncbi:formimidoylglutamase [Lysinibacillus sphaericus]|uniref:formimidoylglutamase n=1 Tax=Lysinibacillus sphaericus TaxID=1421 RepID=UPI0013B072BD|nr:formimidoylglutamase [Lysinibacillus sphaericus]MEB7453331.1 formimidoylglutamase [Lysinibacillus sphaericus]QIC46065.1 formimidoylglutamase [Lysinibacillus sphaericus]